MTNLDSKSSPLHVVLGAGQVGPLLVDELLAKGFRVRVVKRGAPTFTKPGVEWLRGDLRDPAFARQAMQGASVVYNTTNPEAYSKWDELLLPLVRNVRAAAEELGVKLVVLDNLYMIGPTDAVPFDEDEPMRPTAHKGELRKMLALELAEAQARGLVATTGRAADFFGPGSGSMSMLGDRLGEKLATGGAVEVFGDPELPRSYSYVPDVARGLATLGTRDESWGKLWNLPVAWQGTTREIIEAIAGAAGKSVKLRRVPDALLFVGGLFWRDMGAMREMTYQWKKPYLVDDRRFRATFGVEPTPADVAVRDAAAALVALRAAA